MIKPISGAQSSDPRPRVGLIGAGMISHAHVPGWLHLGADVSVYSHDGASALAARYGVSAAGSLDELLDTVDVVDIVTPTATHVELALAAIERGKHVVCEKPLARTPEAAARVADAAKAAGVTLFPAHVVRYFPEYVRLRRSIQSGRIGRPAVARLRRQSSAPAMPWFHDEQASGGIVMDQMIHDLDQAEWLLGPATDLFARSRTLAEGSTTVTAAHVVLTHASGAISVATGTWGSSALPFSYAFDVAGDEGVLRFDSATTDSRRTYVASGAGATYVPTFDAAASPYTAELADALRAIRTGAAAGVTAADGVRAVELAAAAAESIRTGRVVPTPISAAVAQVGAAR